MGAETAEIELFVRSLSELHQVLDGGAETEALLDTVVTEAARIAGADSVVLMLLDDDRRRLVLSATYGLTDAQAQQLDFRPDEGVAGWVVDHGEATVIDDTATDDRFLPLISPSRPARSMVAVPLNVRNRTIGVLCAGHEAPGRFGEDQRAHLDFMATSAAGALDNARLYRLALTDPLTGLHNRQHLSERLREEVDRSHRYGQSLSVLMIDLDRFTALNAQHGHGVGDTVLAAAAHRIHGALREVDILARYAGQAFVAVLPCTGRAGAERVADRVLETVRAMPFDTEAAPVTITASVGGAVLGPREEARDLLVRADAALLQAKSQGRDRAVFNWLCFASVS